MREFEVSDENAMRIKEIEVAGDIAIALRKKAFMPSPERPWLTAWFVCAERKDGDGAFYIAISDGDFPFDDDYLGEALEMLKKVGVKPGMLSSATL